MKRFTTKGHKFEHLDALRFQLSSESALIRQRQDLAPDIVQGPLIKLQVLFAPPISKGEVVALCDIDDASFKKPLAAIAKAGAKAPRLEKDFRKLLNERTEVRMTVKRIPV